MISFFVFFLYFESIKTLLLASIYVWGHFSLAKYIRLQVKSNEEKRTFILLIYFETCHDP